MSGPDTRTWGDIPMGFSASSTDRSAQVIQIDKSSAMLGIVALVFACVALGAVLVAVLAMPQLTDAKIDARHAEIAANANAARQDARIALDKVEQTQVQLGAKGIVFPSTH